RQDSLDVALDPTFAPLPVAARDVRRERRDLEVVLDVDRQRVGDRRACHGALTRSWYALSLLHSSPQVGGDPAANPAVPEFRDAATLATAREQLVDAAEDRKAVGSDDRVRPLLDGRSAARCCREGS